MVSLKTIPFQLMCGLLLFVTTLIMSSRHYHVAESNVCSLQNRRSNSYTVFQLRSRKLNRLPIVDFKPKDYGKPWQQFGFEIGPICYS